MRLKKWVIEPGSYWYADKASGMPRRLDASAADVKRWHDDGKAMLASELTIPVPIEHQEDATPKTRAQLAAERLLNNAGKVVDFEMQGDTLYSVLDIDHDEVARKIPRGTIEYTSPNFDSFTDGNGKRWDGVITHLALTTRPRLTRQKPFESVAAALSLMATQQPVSLSSFLEHSAVGKGGVSLCRAGKLVIEAGKPPRPAYPLAFSLYAGAALAEGELPEKKKPAEPPPPDAKASPDKPATPGTGLDAPPPEAKALVDSDGDMKAADVACHLAEMMGINVPEGDPESFLERFIKAAFEHLKAKGDDMTTPNPTAPPPPAPKPPAAPPPPVKQEQPPLYMGLSLEDAKKRVEEVADPGIKALLQAAFSMQEDNARKLAGYQKEKLARAQAELDARVETLARRVPTQAFRDKLQAARAAPSMALALSSEGDVVNPMASMLDVLEAGVRNLPDLLTAPRSELQALAHPQEFQGEALTEQQTDEAADLLASRMSGLAPKKAS